MVRKEYQEGDSDLRTQDKEGCQDIRHLTSTASVTKEKSEAAWYRGGAMAGSLERDFLCGYR